MSLDFSQLVIGVSISESEDLGALGLDNAHLHEAMVQVAHVLLARGVTLVYGGDLRPGSFTSTLFDVARSLDHGSGAPGHDDRSTESNPGHWTQRLVNAMSWPYYDFVAKAEIARLMSVCMFSRIDPTRCNPNWVTPHSYDDQEEEHQLMKAYGLLKLRELLVSGHMESVAAQLENPIAIPRPHARICLGGKRHGFGGWLPGIPDEIAQTLRAQRPLFLCGGYGGAVSDLGAYLAVPGQEDADFPPVLDLEWQREQSHAFSRLIELTERRHLAQSDVPSPGELYRSLQECISEARDNGGLNSLANGLNEEQNLALLREDDAEEIAELILAGLEELVRSGAIHRD